MKQQLTVTAVYASQPEGGYCAYIEEIPSAYTRGATIEEARANLKDVFELIYETNREHNEEVFAGRAVVREALSLDVPPYVPIELPAGRTAPNGKKQLRGYGAFPDLSCSDEFAERKAEEIALEERKFVR